MTTESTAAALDRALRQRDELAAAVIGDQDYVWAGETGGAEGTPGYATADEQYTAALANAPELHRLLQLRAERLADATSTRAVRGQQPPGDEETLVEQAITTMIGQRPDAEGLLDDVVIHEQEEWLRRYREVEHWAYVIVAAGWRPPAGRHR